MVWKSSFVDFSTSFGNEDRRENRTRNVTGFPGCLNLNGLFYNFWELYTIYFNFHNQV